MSRTELFCLESAFSGVFLWLGLYLITRDNPVHGRHPRRWWQRPALAAGVAFICMACFLVGIALGVISDDSREVVLWQRLTWWGAPVACSAFFWSVILVTTQHRTPPRVHHWSRIASFLLLAYASCVAVIGTATSYFFQFEAIRRVPRPPHYLEVPPRFPFYVLFVALVAVTLLATTFLLFYRYYAARDEARKQLQWLGNGTALAGLGAMISLGAFTFPYLHLRQELGDALMTVGVLVMGYSVARYNALFQHQIITRDFSRSLAGVIVTSGGFVLVFSGVHWLIGTALTPESIPVLIWLATLTLTLRPWLSNCLDQIFLPRAVVVVRRVLRRASDQLVTAQDQHQALHDIEHRIPETITATLMGLALQDLETAIQRDIDQLFHKTHYTDDADDDYIIHHTHLLDLAIVEHTATQLMEQEGVSPAMDREYYRLKALRQIIRTLIQDMRPGTSSHDDILNNVKGNRFKKQQARYLILEQQFIEDIPRNKVQQAIQRTLDIGYGGGYGRLLDSAKKDLAKRLYLAERRIRETRSERIDRGIEEEPE